MTDPRETLARIRKQADAATDEPWEAYGTVIVAYTGSGGCRGCSGILSPDHLPDCGYEQIAEAGEQDAEFIAAARTDVPALVNALEKVLNLHVRAECPTCGSRDGEGNEFHKCDDDAYCEECDLEGYPCPTVEAITAVLEGEPHD